MADDLLNSQDSKSVLQDGTGTPYLSIFDGQGKSIIDEKNNLPIGVFVTDFEYTYDEDDDDSGHFTIETDNPEIVANSALNFQMPLKLQWGIIYPSRDPYIGPVRNVIIIGKETDFTPQGIKLTLNFASGSILSKTTPSQYYSDKLEFFDILNNALQGNPCGVKMFDYTVENSIETLVAERVTDIPGQNK